ncbi:MAG: PilT/PilU family type 4a pilus ATPase [Acidobacteria bacterium]|nr:MAG: PilT/PilU family type 4a pilus ATPase [Acidobacteriota bacterium]REK11358.1 MAG: PilT/PilU family type 4a pilus ATPase [Acidobacteriota bacterium]
MPSTGRSPRQLDRVFRALCENGGSDLHLVSGLVPRQRVHGEIQELPGWQPLSGDRLAEWLREVATPEQWQEFENDGDLDFACELPGVARFRANYLRQQNGPSAVFRVIPEEIVPLEDLGLPAVVAELAGAEEGLVLVTGPTGSGKSTTMASILDRMNREQQRHIVTIEDPVEFVHQPRRSLISHREVGSDTCDFAAAIRGAVRQDADVLLVGEMRDLETIKAALTAAEMGALVFGTLHTNSAAKTIDRVVEGFPAEEQSQVRTSFAASVRAIVSQVLLRRPDGAGRVAALEILLRAPGLENALREGNQGMVQSILQGGKARGMQTMDDAILELVRARRADPRDAYRKMRDKARFEQEFGLPG